MSKPVEPRWTHTVRFDGLKAKIERDPFTGKEYLEIDVPGIELPVAIFDTLRKSTSLKHSQIEEIGSMITEMSLMNYISDHRFRD